MTFTHQDTGATQLTSSGLTVSVTLANAVSAGDLLVGIVGGPVTPSSANITDNSPGGSNTWTIGANSNFQTVIYCLSAKSAPSGITITMTLTTSGSLFLGVDRFSASGAVSLASATAGAGASGTSGTTPSVSSSAGGLLWGGLHTDTHSITFTTGHDSTSGDTATGGFSSATTSGSAFSEYVLSVSTSASQGLTWTSSGSLTSTAGQGTAAFTAASSASPYTGFSRQSGFSPKWGPRLRQGHWFSPGWGQGNQGTQFPLWMRQGSRSLLRTVRPARGQFFNQAWGQAVQGVPLWIRQSQRRPNLRLPRRSFQNPVLGQGNQGIKFPLFLRQTGNRSRWLLRRSQGKFTPAYKPAPIESGPLHILIPGSSAHTRKGALSIALPLPKTALTGYLGTISVFGIKIPVLKTSLNGAVNLLRIALPLPKTSINGKVIHQPLHIMLPPVVTGLSGKPGHAGTLHIAFAQALMGTRRAALLEAGSPQGVEWTLSSPAFGWRPDDPRVNWRLGAVTTTEGLSVAITLSTTFTDFLLGHATGSTASVADQIGGGTLVVYASGGSPPAGPNEASVGTVLATFTFSAAASQGAPSAGSMNLAFSNQTVVAGNSGTADYFRVISSGAVALIQGSVGTSAADWILSSTTITSGDNVTITGTATIAWTVS